jgi:3-methyladenine DNA glycosylase AlkD
VSFEIARESDPLEISKIFGLPALAGGTMAEKSTSIKATKPTAATAKSTPVQAKSTTMTLEEIFRLLESLGNGKMRAQNFKRGAGDNQFGVKLGDIRKLADKIKTNHELALALWKTGNIDAQFLATLLINVSLLSADEMERMVKSVTFGWVADWLHSYVVKEHADKETLRKKWMTSDHPMAARAGWQLTAGRVVKSPEGLDLDALLNRIEKEMGGAAPEVQWTMNMCLAEIGIHFAKHRKRAIAIGEKLGIYRDYPVSKGCTSPFAPIWINAIVSRQT